jgi:peptidoglycan hydrolase CwlO-like protein
MDTTFKLDLKTLIMLITFVAGLVGMYYSLQSRLDDLEHTSNHVKAESVEIQKRLDTVEKKINKLNRKKPKPPVN